MARERIKVYWVEVPILSNKYNVLTSKPESIPGKIMKIDLTRSLRGRSMEANIKIRKVGEKLIGEMISTKVAQSYIKRMMRKNISWIEDSFVLKGQNGKLLRIKPFMITKKSVHRSVRKELRNKTKELITKHVSENSSEAIFEAVVKGRLQKDLIAKLKKIYPLAFFEIRVLKIETPKLE